MISNIKDLPTYCINLEKRTDRWMLVKSQPGFKDFDHMERYIGVDGSSLDIKNDNRIALLTKRNILKKTRRSHEELSTPGGVGCYLSHVLLWQKFLNDSYAPAMLVFEDDVKLTEDSYKTLQILLETSLLKDTSAYDFCALSASSNPKYTTRIHNFKSDNKIDRLNSFTNFGAYIITRKGAQTILPHVFPIQAHIDCFIGICSSMKIIDVCAPKEKIFRYNVTDSDIYDNNGCAICDVPANFEKESVIIPKHEYIRYKAEETLIIGLIGYAMFQYFMKGKK